MVKKSEFCLKILLALGVSVVAGTSFAQVRTPTPNAPIAGMRDPKTLPPMVIKLIPPAPKLNYTPGLLDNMDGWTKVTQGAIKGSPALTQVKDGVRFLARGGDDGLYIAPLSLSALSIDNTKWSVVANSFGSGVTCSVGAPTTTSFIKGNICYGLNSGGGATAVSFAHDYNSSYGVADIGGQNAGGLPLGITFTTGQAFPGSSVYPNSVVSVVTAHAGTDLWIRPTQITNWLSTNMGFIAETKSDWAKLEGIIVGSAAACAPRAGDVYCVYKTPTNFVRLTRFKTAANGMPGAMYMVAKEAWQNPVNSPTATDALTKPLTSAPAIVIHPSGRITVVVRDFDGSLLRIVYNTATSAWSNWSDEGGFLESGSQPSCLADGEVPVCAIQGLDGAGYMKRLPPAAGL